MVYHDISGMALTDYPRPSVAVDVAVLAVSPEDELCVLLTRRLGAHRHDAWQLPGTFLHEGERLADAARRALRTKAGIEGLDPVQLGVLDAPDRDDRGWVLSVAHLDVAPWNQLAAIDATHAQPAPVAQVNELAFDHDRIIELAVAQLRAEYSDKPDPRGLLPEPFTLFDLRRVHAAVAGRELRKDSFRRSMEPSLIDTGRTQTGVVGKPARLFRRLGLARSTDGEGRPTCSMSDAAIAKVLPKSAPRTP